MTVCICPVENPARNNNVIHRVFKPPTLSFIMLWAHFQQINRPYCYYYYPFSFIIVKKDIPRRYQNEIYLQ